MENTDGERDLDLVTGPNSIRVGGLLATVSIFGFGLGVGEGMVAWDEDVGEK